MVLSRERGPSRTARSFSSVFNSSVPQRPQEKSVERQFGGRPIGPNTYHPTQPAWHYDPTREMSVFQSKTELRNYEVPLTSQLDFLGHAGQVALERAEAPGSRGLRWPEPPEPRDVARDAGLDEFCDTLAGSVNNSVVTSSRNYASSFQSITRRGGDPPGVVKPTSADLGPGVYEMAIDSVRIRDPRRQNYTFKSETNSSIFGTPAGQPPDTVQSIQSAILGRHWTSKGVAFSTRERFPRARPKWKD